MKRTVCALLAALTGVSAMTGVTVLSGQVDGTAVDVAHAIPVTVASPLTVEGDEFIPSPDAAQLSALASAAALAAQQTAETPEDAAANNADQPETKKEDASKQDESKEEEAKKEEEVKEEPPAEEETPKQEVSTSLSGVQALGIINGTAVRMRSGAGTGTSILKTLDKHTALAVLGKDGSWYKVSYDGLTGYVHSDYVTHQESASGLSYTGRVTADVLNVRTAAGSSNSSVGSVKNGDYVTVTGIERGWFAVTAGTLTGYVSGDYIALCPAANTTVETPAETPADTTVSETPAAPPEDTSTDTPAAEPVTTPVTGTVDGSSVAALAQQYLGVPYVYGGSSPSGFDCSGFTMYIFSQVGIKLPHGATSQLSYGTSVSRSELQPGDLVFFQDYGAVASHAGIYIGGDQFVHASSSSYNGRCVVISSLTETYYDSHYYTARRH